jgi:hypothetical protein
MMVGTAVPPVDGAGKGAAATEVTPEKEKAKRTARSPLERAENLAGTSGVSARGQPLIPIINRLLEPVQSGDDPEQTKEVLEGRVRPSSTRPWPCSRSGNASTGNSVSMRLPKVLLLW